MDDLLICLIALILPVIFDLAAKTVPYAPLPNY